MELVFFMALVGHKDGEIDLHNGNPWSIQFVRCLHLTSMVPAILRPENLRKLRLDLAKCVWSLVLEGWS